MKKYKEVKEIIKTKKLKKIICNSCGKTETKKDNEHFELMPSITNIKISFGYGSKFDTELHEFDLCDECYEKIISKFKYKPNIK